MLRVKTVGALSGTLLLAGLCMILAQSSVTKAQGDKAEDTYNHRCAMCHAQDGSGNTPMGKNLKLRDLRSKAVQRQSDKQLYDIIAKGKSPMPGYASQLGKNQIDGLVHYIRHLGRKK